MYWDANSLYGWAMSQTLPYRNIAFVKNIDLPKILNTGVDSNIGYIVECDLHFPPELHDKFKEFPPCAETTSPVIEWFSEYQKEVGEN